MSEEERWAEEQIWETLSVAENREELRLEIETLKTLAARAREIIDGETEIKLQELKNTRDKLEDEFPNEKIVNYNRRNPRFRLKRWYE